MCTQGTLVVGGPEFVVFIKVNDQSLAIGVDLWHQMAAGDE